MEVVASGQGHGRCSEPDSPSFMVHYRGDCLSSLQVQVGPVPPSECLVQTGEGVIGDLWRIWTCGLFCGVQWLSLFVNDVLLPGLPDQEHSSEQSGHP